MSLISSIKFRFLQLDYIVAQSCSGIMNFKNLKQLFIKIKEVKICSWSLTRINY